MKTFNDVLLIFFLAVFSLQLCLPVSVFSSDSDKKKQELLKKIEELRKKKAKLNQSTKEKLDKKSSPSRSTSEVIARYEKLNSSCKGKKSERCADVIYALSKLYYDKARDEYIKARNEYEKNMDRWEKNRQGPEPTNPLPEYTKALKSYQRSVKLYPEFVKSDEAYFQIGTILTLNGDLDGAKDAFTKLIHTHPNSIRASAGHFRLSEFCFMDRDFTCALKHIKKIDKQHVNPEVLEMSHYREAEIYYNRAEFDKAVDLFFSYVDKCDRGEYPKRDLRDEALEYLAISFSDVPNGAEQAISYFETHGHREYEDEVIYKVGMKNFNHGQYDQAILALNTALKKFPYYIEAPLAQQMVVSCYVVRKKYEIANEEREKLVTWYKKGSEWSNKNGSDALAMEKASNQVKKALSSIPIYYHAEGQKKKSKEMYEKALQRYQEYIDLFPEEKWKVYEFKYNMAEICNSLRMYEKAAVNYDYVATQDLKTYPRFKMELDTFGMDQEEIEKKKLERKKSSPVAISQEDAGYNAIVALENLRKQAMEEQNLTEEQSFSLPETNKLIDYITNFTTRFPKNSNSPEVMYLAGNVYFAAKKYDQAIVAFKKLISNYPRTKFGKKAIRMLANTQTAAGKYDQALRNYKTAIRIEKPNTQGHSEVVDLAGGAIFKRATDLKKSGDLEKASKIYKSIFDQYPTSTVGDKGWFEAGVSLEEANKLEEAAQTFLELGTNYPKSQLKEKAYVRSAENYKKLEMWEQAGFSFEKAASEIPKAEYAIPSLSSAAENYEKAKMFSKAGQMYENILAKYPTDKKTPLAIYNGGLIYEKGELYERAIEMYMILGDKYPESEYASEGYFSIGICYEKLKKPSQMAKYFKSYAEKFTANRSKQMDALVRAGKAYMEMKKYSDAKNCVDLATTIYTKYKDKATIDPVIASKAYYTLGEVHQKELDDIALKGKSEKQVQQQLQKKTKALEPVLKAYTMVIEFGVGEWTIRSTYQVGKSFVDFATAFENQTLFGRKEQQAASRIQIISGLEKYYSKAMEKFYWNVNTAWEQKIKTEWVDKSKNEFTRLAYKKGFLFEKIGMIFKNSPVPRGMSKEEITAYKDVLEEKYLEALDAALPKYEEGFYAAKELGITGSPWIDSLTARVAFINPSSKILSETITERISASSSSGSEQKADNQQP